MSDDRLQHFSVLDFTILINVEQSTFGSIAHCFFAKSPRAQISINMGALDKKQIRAALRQWFVDPEIKFQSR